MKYQFIFSDLTLKDVEWLRRQPLYGGNCTYNFSKSELDSFRAHLSTLYPDCRVQASFTSKILLLFMLYAKEIKERKERKQ